MDQYLRARLVAPLLTALWILAILAALVCSMVGRVVLGGPTLLAMGYQTSPLTDIPCPQMLPGDSRLFLRMDIPRNFRNQTPPKVRCQVEVRAYPIIPNVPNDRVGVAIWVVDADTHAGVAGAKVVMDGTTYPTNTGGLAIARLLAWDSAAIEIYEVPKGYVPIPKLEVKPGVRGAAAEDNTGKVTNRYIFGVVELRKK